MAKGQSIAQMRTALARLESYELPEKYAHVVVAEKDASASASASASAANDENVPNRSSRTRTGSGTNADAETVLDKDSILRYRAARDTYIRQRTTELLLQHLSSLDADSGQFTAFPPPVLTEEAERDLAERERRARDDLTRIARTADERLDMVRARYGALVERRAELSRTIAEMENEGECEEEEDKAGSQGGDDDDTTIGMDGTIPQTDDVEDVNDEQMARQEERLTELIEKKAALEARLRRIRSEQASVDADAESNRRAVAELRRRSHGGGGIECNDEDADEDIDELDFSNDQDIQKRIEQIEERTQKALRQAKEFQEAEEWYDGMREAIEELGGMRVLDIEQGRSSRSNNDEDDDANPESDSSPSTLTVKFELLDEHILEVELYSEIVVAGRPRRSRSAAAAATAGEVLRVAAAKITSPTTITAQTTVASSSSPNPTAQEQNQQNQGSVKVHIRQPDDLVALASNLPPVDDLRFVVRETQARIRAAMERSEELALLRSSYLTRIGPTPKASASAGDAEQEVVCSLEAGVTVVLRLCADCPLVNGSVYISHIVGVGGWKQSDLDAARDKVMSGGEGGGNDNGNGFASPVALMDALVREIRRVTTHGRVEDDTIELPNTPTLPTRR